MTHLPHVPTSVPAIVTTCSVRRAACPHGSRRWFSLALAWLAAVAIVFMPTAGFAQAMLIRGLGGPAGFGSNVLPVTDDGSSTAIPLNTYDLGGLCIYGRTFTQVFVNNNGNVSFNAPTGAFTPMPFPVAMNTMIAPWWADVDTLGIAAGSPPENRVYWDVRAGQMIVTWYRVGYFNARTDRRNSFQLVIRRVTGSRDYDVEFRYNELTWTTGSSSGGMGGLGGVPAQAGFDAGDLRNFTQLPGSRTAAVLNLLRTSNTTPPEPGRWLFRFRSCALTCLSNADCGGATPICDMPAGRCRACGADTDCAAPTPACISTGTNTGRCMPCSRTDHCAMGFVCDTNSNLCVGCLSNADCSGTRPICDEPTRSCRPCDPGHPSDCTGDTPVCGPLGRCVPCGPGIAGSCRPPTPLCDPFGFRCVSCLSDAECALPTPACGPAGTCVLCTPSSRAACAASRDGRACVENPAGLPACGCAMDPDCAPTQMCDTMVRRCVPLIPRPDAGPDATNDAPSDVPADAAIADGTFADASADTTSVDADGPHPTVRGGACRCRIDVGPTAPMSAARWWAVVSLVGLSAARRRGGRARGT